MRVDEAGEFNGFIAEDGMQTDVLAVLRFPGENLDYGNFKDKIARTPDQARKPYHEVWHVLAKALGAYGSRPAG